MPKPYHTPKSERDEIEGALAEAEQTDPEHIGIGTREAVEAEKDEAKANTDAYRRGEIR